MPLKVSSCQVPIIEFLSCRKYSDLAILLINKLFNFLHYLHRRQIGRLRAWDGITDKFIFLSLERINWFYKFEICVYLDTIQESSKHWQGCWRALTSIVNLSLKLPWHSCIHSSTGIIVKYISRDIKKQLQRFLILLMQI